MMACFSKLPAEIQIQIWKEVAQIPRIIEIRTRRIWEDGPKITWTDRAIPAIPAILHTCFDARKEGLKVYFVFQVRSPYYNPNDCDFSEGEYFDFFTESLPSSPPWDHERTNNQEIISGSLRLDFDPAKMR
jgi:hypothetical protein